MTDGNNEKINQTRGVELRGSDLLPGDILLYRSRTPTKVSRKISEVTSSPYTHASIYIGDGEVAESVVWPCLVGVKKQKLEDSIKKSQCVAVLRTQMSFDGDRPKELKKFVESVLQNRRFYNLVAVSKFENERDEYYAEQLACIRENYGKETPRHQFEKMSFFCSSFVVACYIVVGLIGKSAQIAYPPEVHSPADLYCDPTFGWLLGYLVPENGSLPENDPLWDKTTHWKDISEKRWWDGN